MPSDDFEEFPERQFVQISQPLDKMTKSEIRKLAEQIYDQMLPTTKNESNGKPLTENQTDESD